MLLGSKSNHHIIWQFIPFQHNEHQIERAKDIARKHNIRFLILKSNRWRQNPIIIDNKQVARSAGAEQIVALSLIEALNHLGRRKGPMLMDTPAGRLDLEHRKNVMNYLPQVVTQLALFAHSGELTEEDIYFDRSKIGKKYKISRKTPFHSILEEA